MNINIIFITLFSLFSPAVTQALFSDVSANSQYSTSINWMQSNGVIEGYSDGSFKTNQGVNRVEFLKMIYLAEGLTAQIPATQTNSGFPDVNGSEWYGKFVAYAKQKGTVIGYPDGTFRPSQGITRAEAIKIIMKEFFDMAPDVFVGGLHAVDLIAIVGCENNFLADIESKSWYENPLLFAHQKCIIPYEMIQDNNPPSDDAILPGKALTRGETAELIYRAKSVKDNSMQSFTKSLKPQDLKTGNPTTQEVEWKTYSDADISFQYPKTFLGTSLQIKQDENFNGNEWKVDRQENTIYLRPNFESPAMEFGSTYEIEIFKNKDDAAKKHNDLIHNVSGTLNPCESVSGITIPAQFTLCKFPFAYYPQGRSGDYYYLEPFATAGAQYPGIFIFAGTDMYQKSYIENKLIPSLQVKI